MICGKVQKLYKNADTHNNSLLAFSVEGISGMANDDDTMEIELDAGTVLNENTDKKICFNAPNELILKNLPTGAIKHCKTYVQIKEVKSHLWNSTATKLNVLKGVL